MVARLVLPLPWESFASVPVVVVVVGWVGAVRVAVRGGGWWWW